MTRAIIVGSGTEITGNRVTNDMMAKIMDTSDAWIRERSGAPPPPTSEWRRRARPSTTPR